MMSWEGMCAIAAIAGVITNFIRFGKWQGSMETRVTVLERESIKAFTKFDVVSKRIEETGKLLAEVNAKLEVLLEEHYQRGNHG